MKAFITGINGFAGSYLAEELLGSGHEVYGTVQPGTGTSNISGILKKVGIYEMDILDKGALKDSIEKVKPDNVFHLAGASSVRSSFIEPLRYFEVNVTGTLNVLESVRSAGIDCKILLVSSGEVYGKLRVTGTAVDENAPVAPQSPYAGSKAAMETAGMTYINSYGSRVIIARPLNHIGPRQSDAFFIPTVAKQIAEIEKGKRPPLLELGDLNVMRDFTDVRDIARAYVLLMEKGIEGWKYNICSGNKYLLNDMVDALIKMTGKEIEIKSRKDLIRKNDEINIDLDCAKLKQQTGWKPAHDISTTLKDVLDYWKAQI